MSERQSVINQHEQALTDARKGGDRKAEVKALNDLGNTYRDMGEGSSAIGFYEQALSITRDIDDTEAQGSTLWNMSLAVSRLDGRLRAIELAKVALVLYEANDDPTAETVRKQLAEWRSDENTIGHFEDVLKDARNKGDHQAEEKALSDLGNAYAELGEIKHSVDFYEQALAIDQEMADPQKGGDEFLSMSLAVDKLGGRERAVQLANAALQIYEMINDPKAEKVRKQLQEWKK